MTELGTKRVSSWLLGVMTSHSDELQQAVVARMVSHTALATRNFKNELVGHAAGILEHLVALLTGCTPDEVQALRLNEETICTTENNNESVEVFFVDAAYDQQTYVLLELYRYDSPSADDPTETYFVVLVWDDYQKMWRAVGEPDVNSGEMLVAYRLVPTQEYPGLREVRAALLAG